MAPAITHFLVGATLLVFAFVPIAIRYDLGREHAVWLIPLGGVWGLLPDVHHITPVFQAELYAIHNTAWMDLFALHYTLDRPIVRARYTASVFGSIAAFIVAVIALWVTPRVRATGQWWRSTRAIVTAGSSLLATAYATVVLWVVVSVQQAFGAVSTLVGSESLLVGGLLLVPIGGGLGLVYTIGLEIYGLDRRLEPTTAAAWAVLTGGLCWLVGVVCLAPLWLGAIGVESVAPPLLHGGSLVALVAYGTVFGAVYAMVREGVRSGSERPLGIDETSGSTHLRSFR
ncbi:hypothetical protein [Natrialba sp. INN-245]|uniref:hypothetical protein n=1 Tax=Natrialba sp. INN-245 TaxID=2690967 RepID=UPI00131237CF|nr:hypothetical protein [Natrialba sp. INN-245]MWV40018.1 hypothetical protein [Natrialba sp. INN-245]